MFKTIYHHEISETIKSKTFIIGLIVTFSLIILSTVINIEDYLKRNNDYLRALQIEQAGMVRIYRHPQPLSIFVQGKDKKYGTTLTISHFKIETVPSGYLGMMSNHGLLHAGETAFVKCTPLSRQN